MTSCLPESEEARLVTDQLNVVMPVYNEEAVIEFVVKSWIQELRSLGIPFTLTCLNDASKDGTGVILDRLAKEWAELRVVHKANSGHGPTILQGYLASTSEWIFQVDSDNEMAPAHFKQMWQERDRHDLLIGVRVHRSSPLPRRLITTGAYLAAGLVFGFAVSDVNCPYRLMRTAAFLPIFAAIPKDTFAPNVIISGAAAARRLRVFEVDVPYTLRTTGEVSIKKWKLAKVAVKALVQTLSSRRLFSHSRVLAEGSAASRTKSAIKGL